jgi:hypothetical protein
MQIPTHITLDPLIPPIVRQLAHALLIPRTHAFYLDIPFGLLLVAVWRLIDAAFPVPRMDELEGAHVAAELLLHALVQAVYVAFVRPAFVWVVIWVAEELHLLTVSGGKSECSFSLGNDFGAEGMVRKLTSAVPAPSCLGMMTVEFGVCVSMATEVWVGIIREHAVVAYRAIEMMMVGRRMIG